jgi:hypothetical protein
VSEEADRNRDFWNHALSVQFRQAHHVAYSVSRVLKIPDLIEKTENQDIQDALFESWLVHVRALTEFYLVHESRHSKNDFSAKNFGWDKCHLDDYLDLDCWWVISSRHLLHFSDSRTPEDLFELDTVDRSISNLQLESERFWMLTLDFIDHLKINNHPDCEAFIIALNTFVPERGQD